MSDAKKQIAGVIGSGSFGTTVATLLAKNTDVLLFTRSQELADQINSTHLHKGVKLSERIRVITDRQELCKKCSIIFPVVPSANMAQTIQAFAPYLSPQHILIHATKGFDLKGIAEDAILDKKISRRNIRTMSEVIEQESAVVRIGCLSGPNLSKEILDEQPTATVIASQFDEVITIGKEYLSSRRFYVFGSYDIIGAELAGALKNIIALGSGMLAGANLGKNMQGMLIVRGLNEMIHLGQAMGSEFKSFLGTAGIGDLVATATSKDSRNYSFGFRMAKGESIKELREGNAELAEGVRTLRIAKRLIDYYSLKLPIMELLHYILFEEGDMMLGIENLMRFPFASDVDFLEK